MPRRAVGNVSRSGVVRGEARAWVPLVAMQDARGAKPPPSWSPTLARRIKKPPPSELTRTGAGTIQAVVGTQWPVA